MNLKQLLITINNNKFTVQFKRAYAHLFIYGIFAAIIIPITLVKTFDSLMPRIYFNLYFLCLLLILSAAIVHVIVVSMNIDAVKPRREEKLTQKAKKLYIIFICIFLIAIGSFIGVKRLNETTILNSARDNFELNINETVSENRVDSTLIELERQFERLKDKYLATDINEPIIIELYPDSNSLRAHTGIPDWGDAFIIFESGNTIIHLPAETPSDDSLYKSAREITPHPAHEIAHLIVFSKVGPNYKTILPLWFNEGIAQYESHRGFINRYRAIKRLGLWLSNLYKPDLLEDSRFIINSIKYPDTDVGVYYSASFELVRYIESTHNGSIHRILNRLANDEAFTTAFEEEIGESIGNFYNRWYEDFF